MDSMTNLCGFTATRCHFLGSLKFWVTMQSPHSLMCKRWTSTGDSEITNTSTYRICKFHNLSLETFGAGQLLHFLSLCPQFLFTSSLEKLIFLLYLLLFTNSSFRHSCLTNTQPSAYCPHSHWLQLDFRQILKLFLSSSYN